jgi:hypothetical protein
MTIAEADIAELDLPPATAISDRIGAVALRGLFIEDLVDHPCIDDGALEIDLQPRQPPCRVIGKQQRGDEGEEGSRQHVAVDRTERRIGDDAGNREAGDSFGQRRGAFGKAGNAVGALFRRLDQMRCPTR